MKNEYQTDGVELQIETIFSGSKWRLGRDLPPEVGPPSAAEKAYWVLREKILNLEMAPGSVIKDTVLSNQLGFGRTPIREALKRLEIELLVVSRHRKGTFVKEITLIEYKHQYQIRRQLLALAVALASQAADNSRTRIREVPRGLIENAGNYSMQTLFQTLLELDLEFARVSGNSHLVRTLRQYCGYARRTWNFLRENLEVADFYLDDLEEILFWIQKRNGEKSSQLMANHVDKVHLKVVDRFLETFI